MDADEMIDEVKKLQKKSSMSAVNQQSARVSCPFLFLSLSEKDIESMEYRLFECVW